MNNGIARVLGFFLAGVGHIYKGYVAKGVLIFVVYCLVSGLFVFQYNNVAMISGQLLSSEVGLKATESIASSAGSELEQALNQVEMDDYSHQISKDREDLTRNQSIMYLLLVVLLTIWAYNFYDICQLTKPQPVDND